MTSRAYTITINNWTDNDIANWLSITENAVYSIVGFEVGPKKGTPHMQGYIYFKSARHLTSLAKQFDMRAKLLISKGSAEENRNYCIKDGHYYEQGTMPTGKIHWSTIEEAMKNPRNHIHTYTMYKKSYQEIVSKERTNEVQHLYIMPYNLFTEFIRKNNDCTCRDTDSYMDDDILLLSAYHWDEMKIHEWEAKCYPRLKRGYEIIKIAPKIIVLYYRDEKERNYLLKTYQDILTDDIKPDTDLSYSNLIAGNMPNNI